jgi:D-alanyl-D-alanine carboxypeptidase
MRFGIAAIAAALLFVLTAPGAGAETRLERQLDALVRAKGGPPGAIVTLRLGSRTTVVTAGVADVRRRRRPMDTDHMRIASVAKASSGAVALRLVADQRLSLDATIESVLPELPDAWSAVTVRQMLNHTSGLPDYTRSDGFLRQFQNNPGDFVSPATVIGWVERDPLVFAPGTSYAYSNTDNIVVGVMAEKVSGQTYAALLRDIVFGPLRLERTSLPTTTALPRP